MPAPRPEGDGDGLHLPGQVEGQARQAGPHLLHSRPGSEVLPNYWWRGLRVLSWGDAFLLRVCRVLASSRRIGERVVFGSFESVF